MEKNLPNLSLKEKLRLRDLENFYLVVPTIFPDANSDSEIYREEIFGPVLCAKTFKTKNEAIKVANDTESGLAIGQKPQSFMKLIQGFCIVAIFVMGAIYTQKLGRAIRIRRDAKVGSLCINRTAMIRSQVVTGGFRSSEFGRELGE